MVAFYKKTNVRFYFVVFLCMCLFSVNNLFFDKLGILNFNDVYYVLSFVSYFFLSVKISDQYRTKNYLTMWFPSSEQRSVRSPKEREKYKHTATMEAYIYRDHLFSRIIKLM